MASQVLWQQVRIAWGVVVGWKTLHESDLPQKISQDFAYNSLKILGFILIGSMFF